MVEAGWETLPWGWLAQGIFDPLGNQKVKIQVSPDPRASALKPTLAAWWRSRFAWIWEWWNTAALPSQRWPVSPQGKRHCSAALPNSQWKMPRGRAQCYSRESLKVSMQLMWTLWLTGRWSLQWCWNRGSPEHPFWCHTPPNLLGEGGCWGHHRDVPAATTALPGQTHTDASEANTKPLGRPPSSLFWARRGGITI